ncbi:uncharacterized protein LOC142639921 [Castanea sativa]|uniref:uncharacterized protein LOC142639921 n=1 Tax=Castanea sativa TaxID=21020 RepID=UPI003F65187A
MEGNPSRRNQNLYCTYHKDKGRTTEQCRVLKYHLKQLVKARYLNEFMVDPRNEDARQGAQPQGNPLPPPLGVIEVIHVASRGTVVSGRRGVLTVVLVEGFPRKQPSEKKLKLTWEPIAFNDDDLEGMRLGLKNEDLTKYDTPLVGFDGQMVILEGQISLPVNIEGKEVMVTFIVDASFSPYTAILERPWIHAMGAIPTTMHVKVKFRTKQGITIVRGSQQVARQCLVAAINWEIRQKESAEEVPL